jgi:hypothetical protein
MPSSITDSVIHKLSYFVSIPAENFRFDGDSKYGSERTEDKQRNKLNTNISMVTAL